MIKMIASDLDGTILMQGETQVKRDILQWITKLDEDNQKFVVASGRSYSALKKFFSHHLLQMYFLCENGALIQYQGKTLYKKEIPKQVVEKIIQKVESVGCEWVIAGVHTIYTGKNCDKIADMYKEMELPIMKVQSLREIPESKIRISILHNEKEDKARMSRMLGKDIGEIRVSYQDDTWTDIICKSVDKGVALKWLMDQCGVKPEETAVFGDNSNDIEMFYVTPNSYAMRWADQDVQAAARNVTGCVMETSRELKEKLK